MPVGAARRNGVTAAPRPLAAVIFDLDGVLVDTARLHYAAWKRLADKLALPFDERANEELKGVERLGSLEILLGSRGPDMTTTEKHRLADLKNGWYVESLCSVGAGDILPGALEALEQVRAAGLKSALASASRNGPEVLMRLGIAELFDHVVDPSSLARGKPFPDIFLAAARSIKALPARCLGVEDAAAGVAALKAAGMAVVGIGDPSVLHQADWVLADMTQFRLNTYRSAP